MKSSSPYWMAAKVAVALAAGLYLFSSGWTLLIEDGAGYHGRRPWFIAALSSILVSAALVVWCWGLGVRSDASLTIHADRLEHPRWEKPIYFDDIDAVKYEKPGSGSALKGNVHLRLIDGSIQHLPASLVTVQPRRFQRRLNEALQRHRTGTPPLS